MKTGIELIADERQRQVEVEGWTPKHDDEHDSGELALAAICYASPFPVKVKAWTSRPCSCRSDDCPHLGGVISSKESWRNPWPWDAEWDKRDKHDRIRQLVIAGALIAAEIDRRQRIEKLESYNGPQPTIEKHTRL